MDEQVSHTTGECSQRNVSAAFSGQSPSSELCDTSDEFEMRDDIDFWVHNGERLVPATPEQIQDIREREARRWLRQWAAQMQAPHQQPRPHWWGGWQLRLRHIIAMLRLRRSALLALDRQHAASAQGEAASAASQRHTPEQDAAK